jgi:hypothetical protein
MRGTASNLLIKIFQINFNITAIYTSKNKGGEMSMKKRDLPKVS